MGEFQSGESNLSLSPDELNVYLKVLQNNSVAEFECSLFKVRLNAMPTFMENEGQDKEIVPHEAKFYGIWGTTNGQD